jgi:1,6-anhydro-N-acetylmuramate kinase
MAMNQQMAAATTVQIKAVEESMRFPVFSQNRCACLGRHDDAIGSPKG